MDKKKRIKKIESLKEQVKKHQQKIRDYEGNNEFLIDYWGKEISRFKDEIREEEDKLERKD